MRSILLTFDIEDWFQVENFKENIPFESWPTREQRVQTNTSLLLDLLDGASANVKATFFILGWVAERYPDIVKEIASRGHEIASHGYNHELCYQQPIKNLFEDLATSKKLLEDLTGKEIHGYRAPSFSITDDALKVVQDCGYTYDSSYNSFSQHGRYGQITLPAKDKKLKSCYQLSNAFYEIPVSNLQLYGRVIPWGGGGYFRLLPSIIHKAGVKRILKDTGNYTFYLHPWEIDPNQPRVGNLKSSFKFRHYVNLNSTTKKLRKFISSTASVSFISCTDFINSQRFNHD